MHLSIKSLALSLLLFSLILIPTACQRETGPTKTSPVPALQPANDVNTFVGTAADGNTFPGATMPFGMIQWSPTSGFKEHASGYEYTDTVIRGFSLDHLSGPGCPIMGDVPIMPWAGTVTSSPAMDKMAYSAKFSHADETASPGFYSVAFDNGIKAQLTVTTRAGIGTFTFPSSANANVLFKTSQTANRYGVRNATLEITGNNKISGSVSTGGFCSYPNKYTVYFAAEFHRPFTSFGTWQGSSVKKGRRSVRGPKTGGYVGFDTTNDRAVEMKVAISYVSVANAWKNLDKEIPGWDFAAVRKAADATWNHELSLLTISGGTKEEDRVFYTALYHALLAPNVFSDVNGEYMGFDNHVHMAKGYTQYANYSGWDIYRDEVQLISLLHPKAASDMIRSLVVDEQQGGGLPIWPVANDEACQMVGNPACPIIADAYAFGARDFDAHAALKAMLVGATKPGAKCNGCPEWDSLRNYLKNGYIGPDDSGQHLHLAKATGKAGGIPKAWAKSLNQALRRHSTFVHGFLLNSGPSQMLEFTTADFSIAQMAKVLGDTTTYQTFMKRAQFWRNTFNTKSGYIEPRRNNGSFISVNPADPHYYVEGNAAQYSWMVPYNMRSLINLMGGKAAVVKRLNTFFTELNAGDHKPYFWIGNEPVFAVPWAYDFAGAPWRTQDVVRRVETELYTSKPDGLPGNDDLGAMSAWYVFASLGAYPAIPGVGGFALDSPLFPKVVFHLGNGKVVTIEGGNASAANPYVQSFKVDGRSSERTWIPYDTFAQGATLQFKLGPTPNKAWGSTPDDAPPSFTEGMATHGK